MPQTCIISTDQQGAALLVAKNSLIACKLMRLVYYQLAKFFFMGLWYL